VFVHKIHVVVAEDAEYFIILFQVTMAEQPHYKLNKITKEHVA